MNGQGVKAVTTNNDNQQSIEAPTVQENEKQKLQNSPVATVVPIRINDHPNVDNTLLNDLGGTKGDKGDIGDEPNSAKNGIQNMTMQ